MMALSLVLGVAMAAEIGVGPRVSVTLDDPFLTQVGLGVAGSLSLDRAPWLGMSGGAMLFPELEAGYRCLCQSASELAAVTADLSPMQRQGWLSLELSTPALGLGAWETRVGLHGGVAGTATKDALDRLGVSEDEAPEGTVEQLHLSPLYGLHAELRRGRLGARVDLDRTRWTEQFLTLEERRDPLTLSASFQSWF